MHRILYKTWEKVRCSPCFFLETHIYVSQYWEYTFFLLHLSRCPSLNALQLHLFKAREQVMCFFLETQYWKYTFYYSYLSVQGPKTDIRSCDVSTIVVGNSDPTFSNTGIHCWEYAFIAVISVSKDHLRRKLLLSKNWPMRSCVLKSRLYIKPNIVQNMLPETN